MNLVSSFAWAPGLRALRAVCHIALASFVAFAARAADGPLTLDAAIEHALRENRYNKTKTAAALGITFRALRYKLKKLGID